MRRQLTEASSSESNRWSYARMCEQANIAIYSRLDFPACVCMFVHSRKNICEPLCATEVFMGRWYRLAGPEQDLLKHNI